MTKNDIINDVVSSLVICMNQDQIELVKSTFVVKMQGYEIHEICTLPSVEIKDNEFVFKRFAVDMLAKGLKMSSIKAYMNVIKPFFLTVGKNYMEITSQDIVDYMAVKKIKLNSAGRLNSHNYISNINRILFIFFEWAYRKHHINVDVMRDVDRIRARQKRKDRITNEEIEACRELLKDDREKALFELMLSTGLRVGEISMLKVENVDLNARKIHIKEGKTDSSERDVFLTIKARNALKKYLGTRYEGYVFRSLKKVTNENKPICNSALEKIAKDIGKRANCHCKTTVHTYRRTFASEEYRRTGNVKYVSLLLGHSSTAVTEKYYLVDDMKDIEYKALY